MHVRELAEVAGLVTLNSPQFVAAPPPIRCGHLEQYWATSKCRFDGWARVLKRADSIATNRYDEWLDLRASIDEIFVSELLARVWTALLVLRDRRWHVDSAAPVARSVLGTHLDARRRALALLMRCDVLSARQASVVNRLRRRAERWADALLGGLAHLGDVREFAVDSQRVEDFATDLADHGGGHATDQFWRLLLMSLRNAFRKGVSPIVASADANARITASILGCFQAELFDSTGVFKSLWVMRMSANTADLQGMITELLANGPPRPRLPGGRRGF